MKSLLPILLIALFVGLPSATLATNCEELFIAKPMWFEEQNIIMEVEGYLVPGSSMVALQQKPNIPEIMESHFFITKEFIEKAEVPLPKGAQSVTLRSYSYSPAQEGQPLPSRGSGRDHLIPIDFVESSGAPASYSIKGSGINLFFSANNGKFDLTNFRTNGLQTVPEATAEFIVMRQMEIADVPHIGHVAIVILPKEILGEQMAGSELWPAQTVRDLKHPRESIMGKDNIKLTDKIRLIAKVIFWNIGHGAINIENMANARIADPGHVTFGYALKSGLYRCLLCADVQGGRDDGTMVGMMDHYFGVKNSRSFEHRVLPEVFDKLITEVFRSFTPKLRTVKLNAQEREAFQAILGERVETILKGEGMQVREAKRLRELTSLLLGLEKPVSSHPLDLDSYSTDFNISLRFLIQVALLRHTLPGEKASAAMKARSDVTKLAKKGANHIQPIYDLVDRIVGKNKLKPKHLKIIYHEFLPVNVVQDKVVEAVSSKAPKDWTQENLTLEVEKLAQELSAPVINSPVKFLESLREVLD